MSEQGAREKFAILMLVEPGAFDVEKLEPGGAPRQRKRVDGELGNRLVRLSVGLVVENMDGSVSHLKEINVPGDHAGRIAHARREFDAMLVFERDYVGFFEPDGNFNCDGHAVIREHELLQHFVAQLVVADSRNDQSGCVGRGVCLRVYDEVGHVRERGARLRCTRLRIVVAAEKIVSACGRNRNQEIGEWGEMRIALRFASSCPSRRSSSFGRWNA